KEGQFTATAARGFRRDAAPSGGSESKSRMPANARDFTGCFPFRTPTLGLLHVPAPADSRAGLRVPASAVRRRGAVPAARRATGSEGVYRATAKSLQEADILRDREGSDR